MAILYDLSPLDVLDLLDYGALTGQDRFEAMERASGVKLPSLLFDYLCAADQNPLMCRSFIRIPGDTARFPFFYDDIARYAANAQAERSQNPDCDGPSEFDSFLELPRDRWPEIEQNQLIIGCGPDYMVCGVSVDRLGEEDPIVNRQIIEDPRYWVCLSPLSSLLAYDLCEILLGHSYYDPEYEFEYDHETEERSVVWPPKQPVLTVDEALAKTGWRRWLLTFPPVSAIPPGRICPPQKGGLEAYLQDQGLCLDQLAAKDLSYFSSPTLSTAFACDQSAQTLYAIQIRTYTSCSVAVLTKEG